MHTISSLESSKNYSGRDRTAQELQETSDSTKRVSSQSSLDSQADRSGDNVDFSSPTQSVLDQIADQLHSLLDIHPQYRHLIEKRSPSSESTRPGGPAALGKIQRFLHDPHLKRLAAVNGEFAAFYRRIETLGGQAQNILSEMRQDSRSSQAATYSRPRKA